MCGSPKCTFSTFTTLKEQSQPNPKDSEVTDISDQVIGTEMPKTSSKSSVRSKAIKTSVKSKSASQASLKNDVDATNEVHNIIPITVMYIHTVILIFIRHLEGGMPGKC